MEKREWVISRIPNEQLKTKFITKPLLVGITKLPGSTFFFSSQQLVSAILFILFQRRNNLNGKGHFTVDESVAIKTNLFPALTIDYLFSESPIEACE